MRDFTWNYFSMTGDVNAYLFYKEITGDEGQPAEEGTDEAESDVPDLAL